MSNKLFYNKVAKGLVSLITIIILLSSILATSVYYNNITGNVVEEISLGSETGILVTVVDEIEELSFLNEGWYQIRSGFVFYLDTFNSYAPLYIKVKNPEQQNGLLAVDKYGNIEFGTVVNLLREKEIVDEEEIVEESSSQITGEVTGFASKPQTRIVPLYIRPIPVKNGEKYRAAEIRYGLPTGILDGLFNVESKHNPSLINKKTGAAGIGQLMPDTARRYGVTNPLDIDQNIDASARLLRDNLNAYNGDMALALAAYNSGEGTVNSFMTGKPLPLPSGQVINPQGLKTGGIPPYDETQSFVTQVLASQATYRMNSPLGAIGDLEFDQPSLITPQMFGSDFDLNLRYQKKWWQPRLAQADLNLPKSIPTIKVAQAQTKEALPQSLPGVDQSTKILYVDGIPYNLQNIDHDKKRYMVYPVNIDPNKPSEILPIPFGDSRLSKDPPTFSYLDTFANSPYADTKKVYNVDLNGLVTDKDGITIAKFADSALKYVTEQKVEKIEFYSGATQKRERGADIVLYKLAVQLPPTARFGDIKKGDSIDGQEITKREGKDGLISFYTIKDGEEKRIASVSPNQEIGTAFKVTRNIPTTKAEEFTADEAQRKAEPATAAPPVSQVPAPSVPPSTIEEWKKQIDKENPWDINRLKQNLGDFYIDNDGFIWSYSGSDIWVVARGDNSLDKWKGKIVTVDLSGNLNEFKEPTKIAPTLAAPEATPTKPAIATTAPPAKAPSEIDKALDDLKTKGATPAQIEALRLHMTEGEQVEITSDGNIIRTIISSKGEQTGALLVYNKKGENIAFIAPEGDIFENQEITSKQEVRDILSKAESIVPEEIKKALAEKPAPAPAGPPITAQDKTPTTTAKWTIYQSYVDPIAVEDIRNTKYFQGADGNLYFGSYDEKNNLLRAFFIDTTKHQWIELSKDSGEFKELAKEKPRFYPLSPEDVVEKRAPTTQEVEAHIKKIEASEKPLPIAAAPEGKKAEEAPVELLPPPIQQHIVGILLDVPVEDTQEEYDARIIAEAKSIGTFKVGSKEYRFEGNTIDDLKLVELRKPLGREWFGIFNKDVPSEEMPQILGQHLSEKAEVIAQPPRAEPRTTAEPTVISSIEQRRIESARQIQDLERQYEEKLRRGVDRSDLIPLEIEIGRLKNTAPPSERLTKLLEASGSNLNEVANAFFISVDEVKRQDISDWLLFKKPLKEGYEYRIDDDTKEPQIYAKGAKEPVHDSARPNLFREAKPVGSAPVTPAPTSVVTPATIPPPSPPEGTAAVTNYYHDEKTGQVYAITLGKDSQPDFYYEFNPSTRTWKVLDVTSDAIDKITNPANDNIKIKNLDEIQAIIQNQKVPAATEPASAPALPATEEDIRVAGLSDEESRRFAREQGLVAQAGGGISVRCPSVTRCIDIPQGGISEFTFKNPDYDKVPKGASLIETSSTKLYVKDGKVYNLKGTEIEGYEFDQIKKVLKFKDFTGQSGEISVTEKIMSPSHQITISDAVVLKREFTGGMEIIITSKGDKIVIDHDKGATFVFNAGDANPTWRTYHGQTRDGVNQNLAGALQKTAQQKAEEIEAYLRRSNLILPFGGQAPSAPAVVTAQAQLTFHQGKLDQIDEGLPIPINIFTPGQPFIFDPNTAKDLGNGIYQIQTPDGKPVLYNPNGRYGPTVYVESTVSLGDLIEYGLNTPGYLQFIQQVGKVEISRQPELIEKAWKEATKPTATPTARPTPEVPSSTIREWEEQIAKDKPWDKMRLSQNLGDYFIDNDGFIWAADVFGVFKIAKADEDLLKEYQGKTVQVDREGNINLYAPPSVPIVSTPTTQFQAGTRLEGGGVDHKGAEDIIINPDGTATGQDTQSIYVLKGNDWVVKAPDDVAVPQKGGTLSYENPSIKQALWSLGFGYYDGKSKSAIIEKEDIIAFQKKHGLTQDGVIGPLTAAKINEVLESERELQKPAQIVQAPVPVTVVVSGVSPPKTSPPPPKPAAPEISKLEKVGNIGQYEVYKEAATNKPYLDLGLGEYAEIKAGPKPNTLNYEGIDGKTYTLTTDGKIFHEQVDGNKKTIRYVDAKGVNYDVEIVGNQIKFVSAGGNDLSAENLKYISNEFSGTGVSDIVTQIGGVTGVSNLQIVQSQQGALLAAPSVSITSTFNPQGYTTGSLSIVKPGLVGQAPATGAPVRREAGPQQVQQHLVQVGDKQYNVVTIARNPDGSYEVSVNEMGIPNDPNDPTKGSKQLGKQVALPAKIPAEMIPKDIQLNQWGADPNKIPLAGNGERSWACNEGGCAARDQYYSVDPKQPLKLTKERIVQVPADKSHSIETITTYDKDLKITSSTQVYEETPIGSIGTKRTVTALPGTQVAEPNGQLKLDNIKSVIFENLDPLTLGPGKKTEVAPKAFRDATENRNEREALFFFAEVANRGFANVQSVKVEDGKVIVGDKNNRVEWVQGQTGGIIAAYEGNNLVGYSKPDPNDPRGGYYFSLREGQAELVNGVPVLKDGATAHIRQIANRQLASEGILQQTTEALIYLETKDRAQTGKMVASITKKDSGVTKTYEISPSEIKGYLKAEEIGGKAYYINAGEDFGLPFGLGGGEIYIKDASGKLVRADNAESIAVRNILNKERESRGQPTFEQVSSQRFFANVERVLTEFQGLGYYSTLFFDEDSLLKWRDNVDRAFATLYLGTEYWSSTICGEYLDGEDDGIAYAETPQGLSQVAAHIEATRTEPIQTDKGQEFIYKITFNVRNGDYDKDPRAPEEMHVNVILRGERTVAVFKQEQEVKRGSSFGRTGRNAIAQDSTAFYNEICLTFDKTPLRWKVSNNEICNTIVESSGAPSAVSTTTTTTTTTTSGGGAVEGDVNDF